METLKRKRPLTSRRHERKWQPSLPAAILGKLLAVLQRYKLLEQNERRACSWVCAAASGGQGGGCRCRYRKRLEFDLGAGLAEEKGKERMKNKRTHQCPVTLPLDLDCRPFSTQVPANFLPPTPSPYQIAKHVHKRLFHYLFCAEDWLRVPAKCRQRPGGLLKLFSDVGVVRGPGGDRVGERRAKLEGRTQRSVGPCETSRREVSPRESSAFCSAGLYVG